VLDRVTGGLDDAHIAVSESVRTSMPRRLRAHTEVVRHGIELPDLHDARQNAVRLRASLGVGPGEIVVGTVANLRANKAYPVLVAAARRVVSERPHVRFVAVGQGPLEADIRALVDGLDLSDRFELLGFRRDALDVIAAMDVFCLASRHEGQPIALMEALALGKPVVATRVGGISELVAHDVDAILIPPEDSDALADALIAHVDDEHRRAVLARQATARRDELSAERAIRRVEAIYDEVRKR
jgi:glycosyltransferase involved in cell wall biosynthesis